MKFSIYMKTNRKLYLQPLLTTILTAYETSIQSITEFGNLRSALYIKYHEWKKHMANFWKRCWLTTQANLLDSVCKTRGKPSTRVPREDSKSTNYTYCDSETY